jgi:hypothetical protein
MAVRGKSLRQELVVPGGRAEWLAAVEKALENGGFTKITSDESTYVATGKFHKGTVWGEIEVRAEQEGDHTRLHLAASASKDSIWTLFMGDPTNGSSIASFTCFRKRRLRRPRHRLLRSQLSSLSSRSLKVARFQTRSSAQRSTGSSGSTTWRCRGVLGALGGTRRSGPGFGAKRSIRLRGFGRPVFLNEEL